MHNRFTTAFSTDLLMSPSDMTRGGTTNSPVLEIVSFRLKPGLSDQDFLALARATEAVVAAQAGFTGRHLMRNEDGLWTDMVNWQSLDLATKAATVVMANPAFSPFAGAIDEASITMQHLPVLWSMGN